MNDAQIKWLRQRFAFSRLEELPVFGSLRRFYRLHSISEARVAIVDDDPEQLTLFVDRASLFSALGVNVPHVNDYSKKRQLILEEDLGDTSLANIISEGGDKHSHYREVIDVLVGWQKRFDSSPDLAEEYDLPEYDFDFAYNESMLFVSRYLEQFTYMTCMQIASLKPYLVDLAEKASSVRKTLMHRDFQSQNILWHKGKPYFVDFQTAMLGPYTYDLASLLYDNYVDLSADEKEELIDYFYRSYPDDDREDFYVAALQRTFQAVSAYAYLSREQGRMRYEQYIPKGLWHLELLAEHFEWVGEKVLRDEG